MPRRLSRARKRALLEAAVSEIPYFEEDGQRTLAGALCLFAAAAHTKSNDEQMQMGAIFYEMSITGFRDVPKNAALEAFVLDMIQAATKKSK